MLPMQVMQQAPCDKGVNSRDNVDDGKVTVRRAHTIWYHVTKQTLM